jgi:hypothetical protein
MLIPGEGTLGVVRGMRKKELIVGRHGDAAVQIVQYTGMLMRRYH